MLYSQPVTQLIRQRFSCRTYIEKPIEKEARRRLRDYAASIHRGPLGGWARFELIAASEQDRKALKSLGTYGFIRGATGFIVGAKQDDGMGLEDFGYMMEAIILFATDMGLGTCWLGGTFTKSSFGKKISVREGELVPAVASVGYVAQKPRKFDALIRKGASADRRLVWEQLFFDGEFGEPLGPEAAGIYAAPLEMVRMAPSASNKQPWRVIKDGARWHFYLQRTPGYRDRALVRLYTVADLQRIDMGIAMCHFETMAHELGLVGRWVCEEPGIQRPGALTEYTASWVSV